MVNFVVNEIIFSCVDLFIYLHGLQFKRRTWHDSFKDNIIPYRVTSIIQGKSHNFRPSLYVLVPLLGFSSSCQETGTLQYSTRDDSVAWHCLEPLVGLHHTEGRIFPTLITALSRTFQRGEIHVRDSKSPLEGQLQCFSSKVPVIRVIVRYFFYLYDYTPVSVTWYP